MNSLEFIRQHVTEWPGDEYNCVSLGDSGTTVFYNSTKPPYHMIDLSEHFAPDYYDDKLWTRREFEASTLFVPDWDDAPSWATYYGVGVGIGSVHVWYNNDKYMYAHDKRRNEYKFGDDMGKRSIDEITLYMARPTTTQREGIDATVTPNDGEKYEATIIGLCGTPVKIDIYRVLDAYPQDDPHIEHLIKKALKPGQRGHKDKRTDYLNIIESAQKALKLLDQKEQINDGE